MHHKQTKGIRVLFHLSDHLFPVFFAKPEQLKYRGVAFAWKGRCLKYKGDKGILFRGYIRKIQA